MKRMQLTDEEARIIEQRRLMTNRESLGYNEALRDLNAVWPSWNVDREVAEQIQTWIEQNRRTIKP